MIEVGRFSTRADADSARSLLAAVGIPGVLTADGAPGGHHNDASAGARLLVADADVHDAFEILRIASNPDEGRR